MKQAYNINHEKAWCYFKALGVLPIDAKKNEWVLHHRDTTLKNDNPVRYDEWRIEDLVPMKRGDHTRLHLSLRPPMPKETREKISQTLTGRKRSEETRRKISETQKGRTRDVESIRKGIETFRKNHPKKQKVKKSNSNRGLFWITNGVENKRISASQKIPSGWKKGRIGWKRKFSPKLGPMSEEHKRKISEGRKVNTDER